MKAVVYCDRDLKVHPTLIAWLLRIMDWEDILFHRGGMRDACVDLNHGVVKALETRDDDLIFAECDIEPTIKGTQPILDSDLDLVSVKYPTECGKRSWPADGFHVGLWRTKREIIADIGLPLFKWPTTPDGAAISTCYCERLANKARKLGYTVGHAGEAGHTPRPIGNAKSLRIKI